MPRLPVMQSEVSATTGAPVVQADANAFGGAVANAINNAGAQLMDSAAAIDVAWKRRQQEDVASYVAAADYSKRYLDRTVSAPEDGKGFYDNTKVDYTNWVDEQTKDIPDNYTREQVRRALTARAPAVYSNAAQYEVSAANAASRRNANEALTSVQNFVYAIPDTYDQKVKDAVAVIDSRPDLTEGQRAEMRRQITLDLTQRRFDGLLEQADTPERVAAVKKDLQSSRWQGVLDPKEYERITNKIDVRTQQITTKLKAVATSAVSDLSARNTDPTQLIPSAELRAAEEAVIRSGDPDTARKFYEIKAQQQIWATERGLNPNEVQARRSQSIAPGLGKYANNPIAQQVADAATKEGLPLNIVLPVIAQESGFNPTLRPVKDGKQLSSAYGIFQLLKSERDGAGIGESANPADQIPVGIRKMKSVYNTTQRTLGREPTAGEFYAVYYMGEGAGPKILNNPGGSFAATVGEKVLEANPWLRKIQTNADFVKWTTATMETRGAEGGGAVPSEVYQANKARDALVSSQKQWLAKDPITYASSVGSIGAPADLSTPEGVKERGAQALQVADIFGIAHSDLKPLTEGEAAQYEKTIREGSADEIFNTASQLRGLGGDVARAAFKQLGETSPVFAHIAGLASIDATTARDVARGQVRLRDDKEIASAIQRTTVNSRFESTLGDALNGIAPRDRAAIRDAAWAYYVEAAATRAPGSLTVFDNKLFDTAVGKVLGNEGGVANVNGHPTVVPPGLTAYEFDKALDVMSPDDLMTLSRDGGPPVYANGDVAQPRDIAFGGRFVAIGSNMYNVTMGDGKMLLSGRDKTRPYTFIADPVRIKELASLPGASRSPNVSAGNFYSTGTGLDNPVGGVMGQ